MGIYLDGDPFHDRFVRDVAIPQSQLRLVGLESVEWHEVAMSDVAHVSEIGLSSEKHPRVVFAEANPERSKGVPSAWPGRCHQRPGLTHGA